VNNWESVSPRRPQSGESLTHRSSLDISGLRRHSESKTQRFNSIQDNFFLLSRNLRFGATCAFLLDVTLSSVL